MIPPSSESFHEKSPVHPALLRLKPLQPGDTIGVAAPGGVVEASSIADAVARIEAHDYRVRLPAGLFARERYLAGDDRQRAAELTTLFQSPTVAAVWCARGGYGAMRVLPYLDFDIIRANPKPLIGFSDVTALLSAFYDRCGMPGIHGPVLTTLTSVSEEDHARLFGLLEDSIPPAYFFVAGTVVFPGAATGVVTGGNLATLCHLVGTPYMPNFSGCILLLEDINEPLYKIDRMVTQMSMAGAFDDVAGLVLGDFENCGAYENVVAVFAERFAGMEIPMVAGAPFGHGTRNCAFPVGLTATLDAERMALLFEGPLFG